MGEIDRLSVHSLSGMEYPGKKKVSESSGPEIPSTPVDRVTLDSRKQQDSGQISGTDGPGQSDPTAKKKWTVLYYFAGNNNIADDTLIKMSRLERFGSDENVNVVTQVGQPENSPYPGATRFLVEKNPNPGPEPVPLQSRKRPVVYGASSAVTLRTAPPLISPPVEKLGPVNMAEPEALADFVSWGMKTYPAEHYMVVLMDHGYGFLGTVQDDKSGKLMSVPEVGDALAEAEKKTGQKADIVGFDSCLMQQAEVAHQIGDHAGYIVGSEEVEYPFGFPEGRMVGRLEEELKKGGVEPDRLARLMVEEGTKDSSMKTISAVDLSEMKALEQAVDGLAGVLMNSSVSKETLRKIIASTQAYCSVFPEDKLCTNYRDLYDFCQKLIQSPDIKDSKVMEAALKTADVLQKAVIAQKQPGEGLENSHGLSIYLTADGIPASYEEKNNRLQTKPKEAYLNLSLSQKTRWDEFLQWVGADGK